MNPNTTVTIQATRPVASESGQQGAFTVFRTGSTSSSLTVYYNVGGTAVPGTDYQALSGSLSVPVGQPSQDIAVTPIDNNTITFDKTVVASLILTNTYFVGSPSQATVTVQDSDAAANIVAVASLNAPVGIDYHPTINELIISVNHSQTGVGGNPVNFARLNSSGTSNTWSSLTNMGAPDVEIKLATVKSSISNWTQGDMYFGTAQVGKIGKITADGSSVNTNWATLPGETNFLGGSLYFDQTGVFGYDLIVVTGRHPADSLAGGAVWRVNASGNATLVAQIEDPSGTGRLLEGVLTVPNDPAKYGPWAGTILTCQERSGLIMSVSTNGTATAYNLGLGLPEDVRLIPSGQNLYALEFANQQVLKVPAGNFTAFAGDILLVNEAGCPAPGLFIVHWEGGRFVVRQIPIGADLEHVSFAPF